eukprot:XP_011600906.1 PREDICTED: cadherin-like protein 26 [Takifugu rubripes]
MSSSGSANHSRRLASEADNSETALDNDSAQHLRLKERQRFHEEVYQHDMDNYPPSAHLQIDCKKPPMGSISSMEVNVDVLEQMDLMDISDQEALDVFLNSGSGADDGIKFDILDKDTKKKLDRELAFDVEVMDLNDNAPAFKNSQMTIEVNEKTTGYLPGKLDVIDRDQAGTPNSKITVSLISQEPKEPQISLEQPYNTQAHLTLKSGCFDYDKIKKYEVRLLAKDQGQPSLSSTAVLTINILDGNTHPPMFKEKEV